MPCKLLKQKNVVLFYSILLIGFSLQNVVVCVSLHSSKHEYNAMASFQTTINIGKTWGKFCLLSFMYRNKISLLTPFSKIDKRGGLKGVDLRINKRTPFCIMRPIAKTDLWSMNVSVSSFWRFLIRNKK